MNEAEYERLVQSAYDDRILVGIDRAFARRLYTDVATSQIEDVTGEAAYLEKLVVWFAFLSSPIAILGSVVLAAYAFHWWTLLIIPGTLLWWMFNRSRSVRGGALMWLHPRNCCGERSFHGPFAERVDLWVRHCLCVCFVVRPSSLLGFDILS